MEDLWLYVAYPIVIYLIWRLVVSWILRSESNTGSESRTPPPSPASSLLDERAGVCKKEFSSPLFAAGGGCLESEILTPEVMATMAARHRARNWEPGIKIVTQKRKPRLGRITALHGRTLYFDKYYLSDRTKMHREACQEFAEHYEPDKPNPLMLIVEARRWMETDGIDCNRVKGFRCKRWVSSEMLRRSEIDSVGPPAEILGFRCLGFLSDDALEVIRFDGIPTREALRG